ncbi:hypothetical protein T459_22353 [Capsicum annuum]|uniref:Uncharacterized protein n=1 Tax=Capsicum annuum TaxID=4072 RepID=A0A2G2YPA6_CAPAN|nr:hypothetical protein T459_22353 [Capsicum annuum]
MSNPSDERGKEPNLCNDPPKGEVNDDLHAEDPRVQKKKAENHLKRKQNQPVLRHHQDRSWEVPAGNSWLGSLFGTLIGNLKISITNAHVRYEVSVSLVAFLLLHIMGGHKFSNPGHPFSCGVTLAKLAAVTTDEQGNETFDTSGALDKLRKSEVDFEIFSNTGL